MLKIALLHFCKSRTARIVSLDPDQRRGSRGLLDRAHGSWQAIATDWCRQTSEVRHGATCYGRRGPPGVSVCLRRCCPFATRSQAREKAVQILKGDPYGIGVAEVTKPIKLLRLARSGNTGACAPTKGPASEVHVVVRTGSQTPKETDTPSGPAASIIPCPLAVTRQPSGSCKLPPSASRTSCQCIAGIAGRIIFSVSSNCGSRRRWSSRVLQFWSGQTANLDPDQGPETGRLLD